MDNNWNPIIFISGSRKTSYSNYTITIKYNCVSLHPFILVQPPAAHLMQTLGSTLQKYFHIFCMSYYIKICNGGIFLCNKVVINSSTNFCFSCLRSLLAFLSCLGMLVVAVMPNNEDCGKFNG